MFLCVGTCPNCYGFFGAFPILIVDQIYKFLLYFMFQISLVVVMVLLLWLPSPSPAKMPFLYPAGSNYDR